jgi:hypothetical protein
LAEYWSTLQGLAAAHQIREKSLLSFPSLQCLLRPFANRFISDDFKIAEVRDEMFRNA